jgi:hypothetical protein
MNPGRMTDRINASMSGVLMAAAVSLASGFFGPEDQPPKLSAEAKNSGSELRTALPRPKAGVLSSSQFSQAASGLSAAVRGARLNAVDSLPKAYFLGKLVSTLKFYAAKKDSETVKARLATVRKMVEKDETIAMAEFLSKGATADVVGSTAYSGMLDDLSGVVQAELAGKKKAYAGLYRAGLVALFLPLEAPLTTQEAALYSAYFKQTNAMYGPFPGNVGPLMTQLAQQGPPGMLAAIAKLDQELSSW